MGMLTNYYGDLGKLVAAPERGRAQSALGMSSPQDQQFARRAKTAVEGTTGYQNLQHMLTTPIDQMADLYTILQGKGDTATEDRIVGRVGEGLMGMGGITTFHGSPYSGIKKFDMNFRGTGEGGLAVDSPLKESFKDMIAHGLYTAENKGIAKGYQGRLSPYNQVKAQLEDVAERRLTDAEIANEIKNVKFFADNNKPQYLSDDLVQKILAGEDLNTLKGSTYTAELLSHPDEFLLWDKPLSEQKQLETIKNAALKEDAPERVKIWAKNGTLDEISASQFYKRLGEHLGSDKAASQYLDSIGIKGVKYLDGNSRGAGEGMYNYVTFAPETQSVITHENGQRIPGAVEDAYTRMRDPESRRIFEQQYPELIGLMGGM